MFLFSSHHNSMNILSLKPNQLVEFQIRNKPTTRGLVARIAADSRQETIRFITKNGQRMILVLLPLAVAEQYDLMMHRTSQTFTNKISPPSLLENHIAFWLLESEVIATVVLN